ncbi:MAG TPA: response regulator [Candidatus Paenibacillus intestinavium]|nr:response regulator [Candidatus Paenibacillus intestinavium]
MMIIKKKLLIKYIILIVLFIGLLFGFRWAWSDFFSTPSDYPQADQGIVDMRGWDLNDSKSIPLTGEWLFYPNQLISYSDIQSKEINTSYIQVPGDWASQFDNEQASPMGYGTYRLQMLVDPLKMPVSLWMQDIEASSSVEINGVAAANIGTTAEHAGSYTAKNVSYTASYFMEGTTKLELLIQVSNFDNSQSGGIVRAIQFGSQAEIDFMRWYSIGFQLVMFTVLLLHSIYACILYLFNPREKSLIIFAILMIVVGISIVADHDNVLMLWLPINYEWTVKIKLLSYMWLSFLIVVLFRKLSSTIVLKRSFHVYTAAFVAYSIFLAAATTPLVYQSLELGLFRLFYFLPFLYLAYLIVKVSLKSPIHSDAIFLILSVAAILSSGIWGAFYNNSDYIGVYYPIDIIAAIIGFSTYWFKKYFRNAEQNKELNEQLQKSDKLKDQFLANTSHELRTPLHGIINIAQTVITKEKTMMNEQSVQDMELLITISRRMSHLIGDLLDVAKLQEHHITIHQQPIYVQSIVPSIVGMLKYMVEGKQIQLQTDLSEMLPPVMADEKRLVQILYNLLHNALKYTEEGSISLSVEIEEDDAIIHIADTGVGMNEETQSRIFLPYEQGSYGISDGRGIGLGLTICKQLVDLHGGTLTVHSELGKGTTFSVRLPLADISQQNSLLQQPLIINKTIDHLVDGKTELMFPSITLQQLTSSVLIPPLLHNGVVNILAVDDDPINLNVLAAILSTEPYQLTTANSARQALDLLSTQQWDLLIVDAMMPHMSGYELTQKIREHHTVSDLPVLLLTARSQPTDIYTGFLSGANDYVTKPVDALELKYRIRALIMLKQSIHERLRLEAAYLQAQIQPHFLFNTLNSIMALSDIDTEKMRDLGYAFASFLRISFNFLNTGELVELAHELELVEAYIYIEKVRFEDRLTIEWEVDQEISVLLPPLSIQPLIENAVKHGALKRNIGGIIHIRISRQDGFTFIEVIDNGKGMKQEQIVQLLNPALKGKGGIGLANTNRRLTQLYGQGLSIVSKPNEGTTVSFIIPDHYGK